MHSLEYECNMVIDRFQQHPSTDYDNASNDWAFESSNALETLQKLGEDFLKKMERLLPVLLLAKDFYLLLQMKLRNREFVMTNPPLFSL